jgi:hypothetical protein
VGKCVTKLPFGIHRKSLEDKIKIDIMEILGINGAWN